MTEGGTARRSPPSVPPQSQPLPQDLAGLIAEQLEEGEQVLWTGRPRMGAFFGLHAVPVFASVYLSLVVAFTLAAMTSDPPAFVVRSVRSLLIFSAGVLVPLVLCSLVIIAVYKRGQQTAYAVTDRHAMVASTWLWPKAVSFPPEALIESQVLGKVDGSGSILLTHGFWLPGARSLAWRSFCGIDDARGVGRLLHDLAGRASRPGVLPAGAAISDRPRVSLVALFVLTFLLVPAVAAAACGELRSLPAVFLFGLLIALLAGERFARKLLRVRRYHADPKKAASRKDGKA